MRVITFSCLTPSPPIYSSILPKSLYAIFLTSVDSLLELTLIPSPLKPIRGSYSCQRPCCKICPIHPSLWLNWQLIWNKSKITHTFTVSIDIFVPTAFSQWGTCLPQNPKFSGSSLAEIKGFFRTSKSWIQVPSESDFKLWVLSPNIFCLIKKSQTQKNKIPWSALIF